MENASHNTAISGRQPTQQNSPCFVPTGVNIRKTCFGNRKLAHLEIAGYQPLLVRHVVALRAPAWRVQGDPCHPGSGSRLCSPSAPLLFPGPLLDCPRRSVVLPARLGESGRSACLPVTQLGWISRLSALHPSLHFRLSSLSQ